METKTTHLGTGFRDLAKNMLNIGIDEHAPVLKRENIFICNALSVILILAAFAAYVFVYITSEYFRPISWYFGLIIFTCAVPLILNGFGHSGASRLILSCAPPLLVIGFSILSKLTVENLTFNDYHNFRIALIVFCNIPFFLFSLTERTSLVISVFINFLCMAMTDVIHHLFNVGYYDVGFQDTHYTFINFFSLVASLVIVSGIIIFKGIIEKQKKENEALVIELKGSNEKIISQNHHLQAQTKRLEQNESELKSAYNIIETQKYRLEEELVIYDHEIAQFSYNVCHHLKGPLATLAGLVNIIDEPDSEVNKGLTRHFKTSIKKLDMVINDLNHILNTRKDIFRQKSNVLIEDALIQALELLNDEIVKSNAVIKMKIIKGHVVFVPKQSLVNIFVNLLSNAIKYREPSRPLVIEIQSGFNENKNLIEIRDNGIGIDLVRFGNDIFKMYKRFHLYAEGKGLGLYLVKLQVSAIGGTIKVNSEEGEYTSFALSFPYEQTINTRFDMTLSSINNLN